MELAIAKRFNINISGNGNRVMMFAHGLGCDQTMWRFITPAFEQDCKIVLFDFLGSGSSDVESYAVKKYSTLQEYANDIIEIITSLNLSNVIFIGHSVGSMIGMLAAIKSPHLFKHIIMVAPSPCYINYQGYHGGFEKNEVETLLQKLKENLNEWSEAFAPVIMGNKERPGLSEELKESFESTDHQNLYHFAELTFKSDLRSEVEKLKTPTLIMQCSDDVIAPVEVGAFMHGKIPLSKIVTMKATGHCAHLSGPHETIKFIKQYLEESGD